MPRESAFEALPFPQAVSSGIGVIYLNSVSPIFLQFLEY